MGHEEQLDYFKREMEKALECKHMGKLGPAEDGEKEMRIFGGIVTWTENGIQYDEGASRHVEIAMRERMAH